MKYRIFCEVSGGVTGSRCAFLKHEGREAIFDDKDSAELEAARLTKRANGPYATATFRYTAEPLGGQS